VTSFAVDGTQLILYLADGGQMKFTSGPIAVQPLPPTDTPEAVQPLPPTETPSAEQPIAPVPPAEILDIEWQWTDHVDPNGAPSLVANPDAYTITFTADGMFSAKADCNMVTGAFAVVDNSFTIEPGPATLAECGPESLSNQFVQYLSNVTSYVLEDGQLTLNLDGGGSIKFAAG
jgi:heat shock protein HslJ